ncbi:MAG: hypothetical protein AAF458_05245 [Pseudomonadota bacterium]
MNARVLVTGFEAYGPWPVNPSAAIAEALDGKTMDGYHITGRVLPVAMDAIGTALDDALNETQPDIVVSVGLYAGAAMLRVERIGINVADFARPDNSGAHLTDEPVAANGADARFATLPVRQIQQAHVAAGLPSVVSNSAGTYLCNATLYLLLERTAHLARALPCGFIHVPFLPSQVAALLDGAADGASGASPGLDQTPSMHLDDMVRGVRIAAEVSVAQAVAS